MKSLVTAFIAAIFLANPALALDSPGQRFMSYIAGKYTAPTLIGVSIAVVGQPATRLDFDPDCSSDNQAAINGEVSGYDWTMHADPNIAGYEAAILSDPSLTSVGPLLAVYFPLLESKACNYVAYTQYQQLIWGQWQGLIALYGSSWLTSTIQTAAQAHATDNGFSLTAP